MEGFRCSILVLLYSIIFTSITLGEAIASATVDGETIEICDDNKQCSLSTIKPVFQSTDEKSGTSLPQSHVEIIELTADTPSETPVTIIDEHRSDVDNQVTTNINETEGLFEPSSGAEQLAVYNDTTPVELNDVSEECRFMSFEEWKKLKNIASESTQDQKHSNESQMKNENTTQQTKSKVATEISSKVSESHEQATTYKKKFNYASLTCAATIVETNKDSKGAKAILDENKDTYLLNECSTSNKFVVIELCQDIQVDSVVVGNFEFFSSMFKELRISVTDRFPEGEWLTLGHFTANNIRDVQTFKIANPLIWARYLKIEILSHYGNEFYCPISLIRVHGKTMMEEYKEESSPKSEVKIEEEVNLVFENYTVSDDVINEECKVLIPYLGINEFLRENSQLSNDYCDAFNTEPDNSQTTTKTAQESIYRTIMKRISVLESNANLSLLYIEEQSKLLSSAFTNLEKSQSGKFESYLIAFNSTISKQLIDFRNSFQNLQNGYSNSFKAQEKLYSNLLRDSRAKLDSMTRELRFQKIVSGFNMLLILFLLVYLVITREAYIDWSSAEEFASPEKRKKKSYNVGSFSKKYNSKSGHIKNKRKFNSNF